MSITSSDLNPEYVVSDKTPTTSLCPCFLHPTRPVIGWATANLLFLFNFGSKTWEKCRLNHHQNTIRSIDFNPVKGLWMTAAEDRKIYLLEDITYELTFECTIEAKITAACFIDDENIAVSDKFGRLILLTIADFLPTQVEDTDDPGLKKNSPDLEPISIDANQKPNVITKWEEHISLNYSKNSKSPVFGHMAVITDMAVSKDQKWLATADRDSKIRLSPCHMCFMAERFFFGHKEFISSVLLPPYNDNKILISASGDSKIMMFKLNTGECLDVIKIEANIAEGFSIAPRYLTTPLENDSTQKADTIRYVPSRLYWLDENSSILVLVEGYSGFLEIPIEEFNSSKTDLSDTKFGQTTLHKLKSTPQALIPIPKNYNCQISDKNEGNPNILFWINLEGKLMSPYDIKNKTEILSDTFSQGQEVGEPVTPSIAYYWKTVKEFKAGNYEARRALRKRKDINN